MKNFTLPAMAMVAVLLLAGCESSQMTPEQKAAQLSSAVTQTIRTMKARDPGLAGWFSDAYGYAVFPSVGKGAFIFGAAHGQGEVFEGGKMIGTAKMTQIIAGAAAGGQAYSEVIFFKDKKAMDTFKSGRLEFAAQASAVAVRAGASADAAYESGVAVFTMAKGGLMLEASIGGQAFEFMPR